MSNAELEQIVSVVSVVTTAIITSALTAVYAVWRWLNRTKKEIHEAIPEDNTEAIITLQRKLDEMQTLINGLYTKVTEVQGVNMALSQELVKVTAQLANNERTIGELKERVTRLTDEKDALAKERDSAKANEQASLVVINKQTEIIEKANEQIAALQKKIHELELENTGLKKQIEGMEHITSKFQVLPAPPVANEQKEV